MSSSKNMREKAANAWDTHRKRARLECRECEVVCERVVSPWHCLKSSCRYVYSFSDGETSYFGCLHKVFTPELDLAAFSKVTKRVREGSDPYGSIRVMRRPRPECRVTIEQAYAAVAHSACCCNPTFFHHPGGSEEERIRMTTNLPRASQPDASE
jgi:hypothetical protein